MKVSLQVLVLEDRKADAELAIKELDRAGFAVDWKRVETMRDFRACLTPKLNLILADYALPGFTVVEALGALKESGLDVPLILVSGTIGDERAVECLKLGATDCILKDRLARLGPAVQRALFDHEQRMKLEHHKDLVIRSEGQMREMLSNLDAVVWSMSPHRQKLYFINPAIEKLTGRPPQDFLADPELLMQQVHAEDLPRVTADLDNVLRWGAAESSFRLVGATGKVRDVFLRAWTAYDKAGKPERVDAIVTDVTERMEQERERVKSEVQRHQVEKLRDLNEFQTRFLGMVAHDLNNVLTPLKINVKMVGDELAQAGRGEIKAIERLRHDVQRMQLFLADLLDASRLQAGELAIQPKEIDVAAKLRETLEQFGAQAAAGNIRLESSLPAEARIVADPHRIEQVTTNLLSNALKFTPAGGTITVELKAEANGDVQILVKDNGPGIAAEDIPKLFQPFARLTAAPQGKHTGTGLGLFICRGIVERHGGKIWCESEGLGKGTAFHVTLPRSVATGPSTAAAQA